MHFEIETDIVCSHDGISILVRKSQHTKLKKKSSFVGTGRSYNFNKFLFPTNVFQNIIHNVKTLLVNTTEFSF
jgi:hypothetical protein